MKTRSSIRRVHPTLPCCFGAFRAARRSRGLPPAKNQRPEHPAEHLAMTNSRSSASTSRVLTALVVCCAVLAMAGVAGAERKRVVVLELEGPKADKFHDDLVKLLGKTHTVVPTAKWNGTADELDASAGTEKNLKKGARKLKIDAIVEGSIEKRRNDFIIRLKLREGRTGALIIQSIDTKASGPRIDARAQ